MKSASCVTVNNNTRPKHIVAWNSRSLSLDKLGELELFCDPKQHLALAISETWRSVDSQEKDPVLIPGFSWLGLPRLSNRGGGVGLLINNGTLDFPVSHVRRDDLSYPSPSVLAQDLGGCSLTWAPTVNKFGPCIRDFCEA